MIIVTSEGKLLYAIDALFRKGIVYLTCLTIEGVKIITLYDREVLEIQGD